MATRHAGHDEASMLRQRAEARLRAGGPGLGAMPAPGMARLVHELEVQQLELELQNEDLLRTRQELEAVKSRYFDHYHLAPVAYVTLSEEGLIREANLAAAQLLELAAGLLLQQPLSRFVRPSDLDVYHLYRHRRTPDLRTQHDPGRGASLPRPPGDDVHQQRG